MRISATHKALFRGLPKVFPAILVLGSLAACAPEEEPVANTDGQDPANTELTTEEVMALALEQDIYNTDLNMQEMMALILEPAADKLWDSGGWIMDSEGYRELYPTTDEGWAYVRAQAAILVESGNSLALPGRAMDSDAWLIYSQGLSDAGRLAMAAAAAQDNEAFFQAGAQLYSVCSACHQAYNPEILNRFVNE